MTWVMVIFVVLFVFVLWKSDRETKLERRKTRKKLHESELLLKTYQRAAMHKLNWNQTNSLVNMAYYHFNNEPEELSKLETVADLATLKALGELRERVFPLFTQAH